MADLLEAFFGLRGEVVCGAATARGAHCGESRDVYMGGPAILENDWRARPELQDKTQNRVAQ
jgi:hypothetical protein